jgi:hypothetical protein
MIKVFKILKENAPYGLKVEFDSPVVLAGDGNDFLINQGPMVYQPAVMMISETVYDIIFSEEMLISLDFENEIMKILISVIDTNGEPVTGSESFIYNNLSDYDNTDNPDEIIPEDAARFEFLVLDNGILVILKDQELLSEKDNFIAEISGYKLHEYSDFLSSYETISDYEEPNGIGDKIFFRFGFKTEMVYDINVIFKGNEKISLTIKNKKHLQGKPKLYFTTKYHLEALINELEIDIKLPESFDLNLMIWKYSQLAFQESGLSFNSIDSLLDYELMVLGNYTAYKIILTKYTSYLLSSYITQKDNGKTPSDVSEFDLGEFSYKKGSGSSTEKIKELKDKINQLRETVRQLSYIRAFGSFEQTRYLTSITNILLPLDRGVYPGKRSVRESLESYKFSRGNGRYGITIDIREAFGITGDA